MPDVNAASNGAAQSSSTTRTASPKAAGGTSGPSGSRRAAASSVRGTGKPGGSAGKVAAGKVAAGPATSGSGVSGAVGRVVGLGSGVVRTGASGITHVLGGDDPRTGTGEGLAAGTIRLPFATASIRLPGPGAAVSLGPVRVSMPTGALYYAGLAALVIGGSVELPVAAGAALAGAVLGRRWLGHPRPRIRIGTPAGLESRKSAGRREQPAEATG